MLLTQDVSPFDPAQWTVQCDVPQLPTGHAILISAARTKVLMIPTYVSLLGETSLPSWSLRNPGATSMQVGWVARTSVDTPLQDLHRALCQTRPVSTRRIEAWLLEQGLVGGTWRYDLHDQVFRDGSRHRGDVGPVVPWLLDLFPCSRFAQVDTFWTLFSGPNSLSLTLPDTRHGAMARLAEIHALEAAHA